MIDFLQKPLARRRQFDALTPERLGDLHRRRRIDGAPEDLADLGGKFLHACGEVVSRRPRPQSFFEEFAVLLRRERQARVRHLGGAESAGRFCCDQQVQSSIRADGCALIGEFGGDGERIENGCSVEESESIVVELLGRR